MKMKSIKAIFRRGQASNKPENNQSALPPPQTPEDLSRSSSVNNLNAEQQKSAKGALAKVRKSASRDKLDKLTEKKNDKKAVTSKNNNKFESEENNANTAESQIELLHRQLREMANEKTNLALELGEQKRQVTVLRNDIAKLKMVQEQSNLQLEQMNEENTALRNRLRDVAHSPLSDNEKQQLLESHRHSSAPASIATNLLDENSGGDITACPTPDWDKHSSSNVSEVSVACLQDKINQMQETHYSTNEELQATLQELTDLQRQLTELQQDNERLLEEKNLMFDSLCRQTERLNDSRAEVEKLTQLLYRDKDDTGQFESVVEREQKLVDLLKSGQEERENLLLKHEQLNNELQEARALNIEQSEEIAQLTERVKTLECTLDAKHAEHKQLDQELALAKDQSSGRQIEIDRLTDLLENARTKINELEQDRALSDKSELDEMLDNARKEKDALESEVSHLKEQVARTRNEAEKLREQVSILQEECKVIRNNAKCTQSELEYKCEKLAAEKANVSEQLQQLQEAANELQVQAQCQLEDKRQLSSVLSETQRNLSETERRNSELEKELSELKRLRKDENEEWEKFQNDLLTSVRVANDFKTEAQQNLQKMIMENKAHRERVKQLELQLEKLKAGKWDENEAKTEPEIIPKSPDVREDKKKKAFFKFKFRNSKKSKSVGDAKPATEQPKSDFKRLPYYSEHNLSKQKEKSLEYINSEFAKIDLSLPEHLLTPEQKSIIKLKELYDEKYRQEKHHLIANTDKPYFNNYESSKAAKASFDDVFRKCLKSESDINDAHRDFSTFMRKSKSSNDVIFLEKLSRISDNLKHFGSFSNLSYEHPDSDGFNKKSLSEDRLFDSNEKRTSESFGAFSRHSDDEAKAQNESNSNVSLLEDEVFQNESNMKLSVENFETEKDWESSKSSVTTPKALYTFEESLNFKFHIYNDTKAPMEALEHNKQHFKDFEQHQKLPELVQNCSEQAQKLSEQTRELSKPNSERQYIKNTSRQSPKLVKPPAKAFEALKTEAQKLEGSLESSHVNDNLKETEKSSEPTVSETETLNFDAEELSEAQTSVTNAESLQESFEGIKADSEPEHVRNNPEYNRINSYESVKDHLPSFVEFETPKLYKSFLSELRSKLRERAKRLGLDVDHEDSDNDDTTQTQNFEAFESSETSETNFKDGIQSSEAVFECINKDVIENPDDIERNRALSEHNKTSLNISEHLQTASDISEHLPSASDIFEHLQTSSDISEQHKNNLKSSETQQQTKTISEASTTISESPELYELNSTKIQLQNRVTNIPKIAATIPKLSTSIADHKPASEQPKIVAVSKKPISEPKTSSELYKLKFRPIIKPPEPPKLVLKPSEAAAELSKSMEDIDFVSDKSKLLRQLSEPTPEASELSKIVSESAKGSGYCTPLLDKARIKRKLSDPSRKVSEPPKLLLPKSAPVNISGKLMLKLSKKVQDLKPQNSFSEKTELKAASELETASEPTVLETKPIPESCGNVAKASESISASAEVSELHFSKPKQLSLLHCKSSAEALTPNSEFKKADLKSQQTVSVSEPTVLIPEQIDLIPEQTKSSKHDFKTSKLSDFVPKASELLKLVSEPNAFSEQAAFEARASSKSSKPKNKISEFWKSKEKTSELKPVAQKDLLLQQKPRNANKPISETLKSVLKLKSMFESPTKRLSAQKSESAEHKKALESPKVSLKSLESFHKLSKSSQKNADNISETQNTKTAALLLASEFSQTASEQHKEPEQLLKMQQNVFKPILKPSNISEAAQETEFADLNISESQNEASEALKAPKTSQKTDIIEHIIPEQQHKSSKAFEATQVSLKTSESNQETKIAEDNISESQNKPPKAFETAKVSAKTSESQKKTQEAPKVSIDSSESFPKLPKSPQIFSEQRCFLEQLLTQKDANKPVMKPEIISETPKIGAQKSAFSEHTIPEPQDHLKASFKASESSESFQKDKFAEHKFSEPQNKAVDDLGAPKVLLYASESFQNLSFENDEFAEPRDKAAADFEAPKVVLKPSKSFQMLTTSAQKSEFSDHSISETPNALDVPKISLKTSKSFQTVLNSSEPLSKSSEPLSKSSESVSEPIAKRRSSILDSSGIYTPVYKNFNDLRRELYLNTEMKKKPIMKKPMPVPRVTLKSKCDDVKTGCVKIDSGALHRTDGAERMAQDKDELTLERLEELPAVKMIKKGLLLEFGDEKASDGLSNAESQKTKTSSSATSEYTDFSDSLDHSYLNIFKSPEEVLFEEISGQKKTQGFIQFHFIDLDESSYDASSSSNYTTTTSSSSNVSGNERESPKIIQMVSREKGIDADKSEPLNYDSLDRISTLHYFRNIGTDTTRRFSDLPNKIETGPVLDPKRFELKDAIDESERPEKTFHYKMPDSDNISTGSTSAAFAKKFEMKNPIGSESVASKDAKFRFSEARKKFETITKDSRETQMFSLSNSSLDSDKSNPKN